MPSHALCARNCSYASNNGLLSLLVARQSLRKVRRPLTTSTVRVAARAIAFAVCAIAATAQAQTPKQPVRTAQRDNPAARETEAPRASQRPAAEATQIAQPGAAKGQASGKGNPPAQPNGAGVNTARPPRGDMAPFKLTAKEQAELDKMLASWEQHSGKIDTFKCRFTRWEYDKTFGSKNDGGLKSEALGEIKYRSPDHGKFLVTEMKEWNGKTYAQPKDQVLEHWVCDGKAIFEYDTGKKQLLETKLPPELQGKAIVDGPLPFIFNAKATTLKERYWLRNITPKEQYGKQIWLDAYPKRADDARNFSHVELILTEADYNPYALQIYLPGGANRQVYAFEKININDPLSIIKLDFMSPRTPFNWTRVVNPVPGPEQPADAKGTATKTKAADPKQANKGAGSDRK